MFWFRSDSKARIQFLAPALIIKDSDKPVGMLKFSGLNKEYPAIRLGEKLFALERVNPVILTLARVNGVKVEQT